MYPAIQLFLINASLWLLTQVGLPLRADLVVPPPQPQNMVAPAVTVLDVDIDSLGRPRPHMLAGASPYIQSSVVTVAQWRFAVPPTTNARTSVTFLFRPPLIYPQPLPPPFILLEESDRPALPQEIVDPGYPVASIAQDAVILEVVVGETGTPLQIRVISGDVALAGISSQAVQRWRFRPAMVGGNAVPSTTFVVISFLRP